MSINQYVNLFNETTEEESERLKKLPYPDFLKTDYWHIVANHVKQRDGFRCTKCGKLPKFRDFLNVHHLTYENRGYEYRTHKTDLITLCRLCHQTLHGIGLKQNPPRKGNRRPDILVVRAIQDKLAADIQTLIGHPFKTGRRKCGLWKTDVLLKMAIRKGLKVEIIVS